MRFMMKPLIYWILSMKETDKPIEEPIEEGGVNMDKDLDEIEKEIEERKMELQSCNIF